MFAEHPTCKARFNPGIIAIVGPTAVGKTAVAVELARSIGAEIVSADSMAVYRGMDIGTAKPDAAERKEIEFHLIDVADPTASFSVGEYQSLAHQSINDILARGKPAIVAGGSGLYVRAAVDGLDSSMPAADYQLRSELEEQARTHGVQYVHSQLAVEDPESAERIHPHNLKRVIRALEICRTAGKPASELMRADSARARVYENAKWFGLTMDRSGLYERIEKRVDVMIECGLIDEVAGLVESGVRGDLPSAQGLGYKEVTGYLLGEYGKSEAIALLKKNTRQFARRQFTWFRADPRVAWIAVDGLTAIEVSEIIKERIQDEQDFHESAGQLSEPG